jgi:tetratricopeptide (TPR) repeat protein
MKIISCLVFTLYLVFPVLAAHDVKRVGLNGKAGGGAQDSTIAALIDLIEDTNRSDIKKAEQLSEQALAELTRNPDDNLTARLLNLIGYRKILTGQLNEPYKDIIAARQLAIANGNVKEEAESYRHEGTILVIAGTFDESLALYIKALNLHQSINSDKIFLTLQGLSLPYMAMGDMDKYLEYGYKLLNRPEAKPGSFELGLAYYTLSYGLIQLSRYEDAKDYAQKSVDIFNSMNLSYTSAAYNVLADLQFRMNQHESALKTLEQSANYAKNTEFRIGAFQNDLLKSNMLTAMGDLNGAMALMLNVVEQSQLIDDKAARRDAYEQLSTIYQSQGEYQLALEAYQSFKRLTDEVLSKSNAGKLAFFSVPL